MYVKSRIIKRIILTGDNMYIIAGLGNPGKNYVNTRHNTGFEAIDTIALKYGIKMNKERFKAIYGEGNIAGERVVLVKPQTFMNLSGESIGEFLSWYKLSGDKLIVIYDDVSLPVGKLRLRPKGSAGGHNGIKSIIYRINSDVFPRIKIGVGSPENENYDLADYVLGRFTKEEIKLMITAAVSAADAVEKIISSGIEKAMSEFNGR